MVHIRLLLLSVFISILFQSVRSQSVVCPAVRTTSGWLDLFPLPCTKHAECSLMGARHLCCKGFCTKGVKAPRNNDQAKNSVALNSTSTLSTTSTSSTTTTSTSTTTTTSTSTTTTTTTTPSPPSTTPRPSLEAALRPFLQLLPIQSTTAAVQKTTKAAPKTTKATTTTQKNAQLSSQTKNNGKSQKLVCPKPGQAPIILFPIPCEKNSQCRASSGPDQVCCEGRCVKGVSPPRPTTIAPTHLPLLGVIPRECPSAPLGELLFEVQSCRRDADCWPRVCCPDGDKSYCRTAKARLDLLPIGNQIDRPVRMLEQYLQCTPPPQYDLFPQRCTSSVDCFPNLCCAEGGKKHCRPAQRSLLALLSGVTQTVGNLRQSNQVNKNKI